MSPTFDQVKQFLHTEQQKLVDGVHAIIDQMNTAHSVLEHLKEDSSKLGASSDQEDQSKLKKLLRKITKVEEKKKRLVNQLHEEMRKSREFDDIVEYFEIECDEWSEKLEDKSKKVEELKEQLEKEQKEKDDEVAFLTSSLLEKQQDLMEKDQIIWNLEQKRQGWNSFASEQQIVVDIEKNMVDTYAQSVMDHVLMKDRGVALFKQSLEQHHSHEWDKETAIRENHLKTMKTLEQKIVVSQNIVTKLRKELTEKDQKIKFLEETFALSRHCHANQQVQIKLEDMNTGYEVMLRPKLTTKILSMKKAFASRFGVPVESLCFMMNGTILNDEDTPTSSNMTQDDLNNIEVYQEASE